MLTFQIPPTFEKPWNEDHNTYGIQWKGWFLKVQSALTPGQYTGTNTNDNAAIGNEGEYISSVVAVASAVSLASGTSANITSVSLTAGDWDVSGVIDFHPSGTTTMTLLQGGNSLVTNTLGLQDTSFAVTIAGATSSIDLSFPIPVFRRSLAATTTIYLVTSATFGVSTLSAYGTIRARRVR